VSTPDSSVVVVTGANSGIGRATALHLAGLGHTVWAGMRDLAKGDKLQALASDADVTVHPLQLDVTDTASVERAVETVVSECGPVDVLVNNAGVGSNTAAEEITLAKAQAIMDTNLFGVWRCVHAVLPSMRQRRTGHIVQISSIAGRLAIAAQPAYCASKFALEAMSECLAAEVAAHGVRVTIVEPGVTRTPMLAKDVDVPVNSPYEDTYMRLFELYGSGIAANVRPERVAETIAAALADTTGRLRWPCAWGGEEITTRRPLVNDEDYVGLGHLVADGPAWRARFEELLGVSIRPFTHDLA
jgi:NAD(P)-dependent dehydrogenase (short-subunit alcohol dehydrogenase family)